MPLIDSHTHFFSRPFFAALAKVSPHPGDIEHKLAALSTATGIEIPSPDLAAHLRRWLQQLDSNKIDKAVSFASLPEEVPAVLEAARTSNGRLIPFSVLDPTQPGAPERAAHLLGDGFRGLVFFPALHHYPLEGEAFAACFKEIAQSRAVALVHCGLLEIKLRDLLGLPKRVDLRYANPLSLIPAAQAHPGAAIVLPHFGGGFFREALMAGALCPNLHLDTSSSNSWLKTQPAGLDLAGVIRRSLEVFGPKRLLFGTDSGTFPRGWRRDICDLQRKLFIEAGLAPENLDLVFGGNALRLCGAN